MATSKAIPPRIARLEKDSRGYPIPWSVLRRDTPDREPVFVVNDDTKTFEALQHKLCPICGEMLGRWKWFIGGPRSAFEPKGWYFDLPAHHECATFALQTCPYLAMPKYLGRIDRTIDQTGINVPLILLENPHLNDRPALFVAVAGDRIEYSHNKNVGPLIVQPFVRPARPYLGVEYWRHGEQIPEHRALPVLRGIFGADWTPPELEET
jgi:hypothetical protein